MKSPTTTTIRYGILGLLAIIGLTPLFAWPPSALVVAPAILIGSGFMGTLFSFAGRVGREAYWLTTIATAALYVGFVMWQATLYPRDQGQVYTDYSGETQLFFSPSDDAKVIYWLFALAAALLALIGLSVSARRWHDHGKSAWWGLVAFVPVIGSIYVVAMLGFVSGTDGPNRYDRGERRDTAYPAVSESS